MKRTLFEVKHNNTPFSRANHEAFTVDLHPSSGMLCLQDQTVYKVIQNLGSVLPIVTNHSPQSTSLKATTGRFVIGSDFEIGVRSYLTPHKVPETSYSIWVLVEIAGSQGI